MKRFLAGFVLCVASIALAQQAVKRSALLEADLSAPATRAYFDTVTRNMDVQAGNGLVVTLGPQTASVTLYDSHGDDLSGWGSGTPCSRAEVLVWREADSRHALERLVNDARRAGWTLRADMGSDEGGLYRLARGSRRLESVLRAYDRGGSSVFVAVLCAQRS